MQLLYRGRFGVLGVLIHVDVVSLIHPHPGPVAGAVQAIASVFNIVIHSDVSGLKTLACVAHHF